MHVFRNSTFRPAWVKHASFDFDTLTVASAADAALPTQESSRWRTTHEFLDYLNGRRRREEMRSELTGHRRGAVLMAGAYQSMARQWCGQSSSMATLDFRTTPEPTSMSLQGQMEPAL